MRTNLNRRAMRSEDDERRCVLTVLSALSQYHTVDIQSCVESIYVKYQSRGGGFKAKPHWSYNWQYHWHCQGVARRPRAGGCQCAVCANVAFVL